MEHRPALAASPGFSEFYAQYYAAIAGESRHAEAGLGRIVAMAAPAPGGLGARGRLTALGPAATDIYATRTGW